MFGSCFKTLAVIPVSDFLFLFLFLFLFPVKFSSAFVLLCLIIAVCMLSDALYSNCNCH